jgi:spore maturation protein CgeB
MTIALAGGLRPGPRTAPAGAGLTIAFYGSSLLSSYWNGAATYYRGILSALAGHGHAITFHEPDAFDRQSHRDMEPPPWAAVNVYSASEQAARAAIASGSQADVVVKASGVGVFDTLLLEEMLATAHPGAVRLFWDVDAPATLAEMRADAQHPLRLALPELDAVFTYGGGPPVLAAYRELGARRCEAIYNALDPTTHHPVSPDPRFGADLAFLGNRLPDRESRVEEFFLKPAAALPQHGFLLGGSGWEQKALPRNVRHLGHVYTADHNAFNCTPLAVLNVARDSMAAVGFSPATRVFEAAGAGACIISDAWEGMELFLAPGDEVLLARDGQDVAEHLRNLSPARARAIGEAARRRILDGHTYDRRAGQVDALLAELVAARRSAPARRARA